MSCYDCTDCHEVKERLPMCFVDGVYSYFNTYLGQLWFENASPYADPWDGPFIMVFEKPNGAKIHFQTQTISPLGEPIAAIQASDWLNFLDPDFFKEQGGPVKVSFFMIPDPNDWNPGTYWGKPLYIQQYEPIGPYIEDAPFDPVPCLLLNFAFYEWIPTIAIAKPVTGAAVDTTPYGTVVCSWD